MSGTIRAIDTASVHRIHSGQVVLDLQGALKELVENALDAGATSVEVRIRDNGLSSIEVVDNGGGIASDDWPSIGLKHHTSKLPSLELLPGVSTFGFRGEALSALCAMCDGVTVTTCTKEMEPMAAVIKLGRDGKVLDDTGRVARQRGTTITLSNLFTPLPVRRKEFERNAKRELSKALTLLTAYALVPSTSTAERPGVRLKVESIAGGSGTGSKGTKRNTLLSNDGRGDLRAGVSGIWGTKALEGVQDLDLEFEVPLDRMSRGVATHLQLQQTQTQQRAVRKGSGSGLGVGSQVEEELESQDAPLPASTNTANGQEDTLKIKVKGLVSSASWGMGRSSADRQYFFINGRPVDAKSLQKALNEVYKGFNTHQVPLAVFDFLIPRESIDINVSPDKRTILLHSEQNLLIAFREALEAFFAPSRSNFAVNGATQTVKGLKMTQSTLTMGGQAPKDEESEGEDVEALEEQGAGASVEDGANALPDEDMIVVPLKKSPGLIGGEEQHVSDVEDQPPQVENTRTDRDKATEGRGSRFGTRRKSNDPITVLDEDEEQQAAGEEGVEGVAEVEEEEGKSEISSSQHQSEPTRASRSRIQPTSGASVSTPSSTPAVAVVVPRFTKRTAKTISTKSAAWSPDRKASQSTTSSKTGRRDNAKTGRDARRSLRERLAVYSQAPSPVGVAEEDELEEDEEDYEQGEQEDAEMHGDDGENDEGGEGAGEGAEESEDVTSASDVEMEDETVPVEDPGTDVEAIAGEQHAEASSSSDTSLVEVAPTNSGSRTGEAISTGAPHVPARRTSPEPLTQAGPSSTSRRYRDEILANGPTGSMTLSFDIFRLRERAAKRRRLHTGHDDNLDDKNLHIHGKDSQATQKLLRAGVTSEAGISNRDIHSAEAALSRTITKGDFEKMEVVGQFNKGFIIARLNSKSDGNGTAKGLGKGKGRQGAVDDEELRAKGTDDLYIVDQHASDEKFNFETLQRETRIKAQKLIKPRSLQLTAADEIVAMENLDVLRANGFEVEIDEDQPPGRGERVKLVAMPVSKETVFDYRDLEQLLHLLSDSSHSGGSGHMVRCTKARAMFAMRACRKSVMIGKSLTKPQMTQLLRNMGTIEQPWNCPHGRPTMRHMTAIEDKKGREQPKGRRRIDWAAWKDGA